MGILIAMVSGNFLFLRFGKQLVNPNPISFTLTGSVKD